LDNPNDPNSPLLILNASDAGFFPSTATQEPGNVGYRINIFDEFRNGPGVIEPVGMYAHVVQLSSPLQYVGGVTTPPPPLNFNDFYLIQYWQFLPFNDFQFTLDIGNHEGDWMWIDVLVERACPYFIRHIVYHHHSDNHCAPTILGGLRAAANGDRAVSASLFTPQRRTHSTVFSGIGRA
jgi:hypothetical protein